MHRVIWADADGRTWVSVAPGSVPDAEAWRYPVIGPPAVARALEAEGWPRQQANAIQAEIVRADILTELQMRRPGMTDTVDGIIRRAIRGAVQTVVDAYLLSSRQAHEGG